MQFPSLNPWMYDLIRSTLAIHVRIGWFEYPVYLVIINLRKKKKKIEKQRHATHILYRAVTFMRIHGELTVGRNELTLLYVFSTDIHIHLWYIKN